MVTYSLKQDLNGDWTICRERAALFRQMRLGPAIKLAREAARDEHLRSGRSTRVEMPGPTSVIRLAQYARPGMPLESAVA